MNTLDQNKEKALNNSKTAKREYLENPSGEKWTMFCNAKRECMLLGVRI